jgi:serine O-acetyltransferase
VGIPARIVEPGAGHADAARMAFEAYAVSADMDDPVNKVLLVLGSRTDDIDGRLAEILRRLEGLETQDGEPEDARRAAGGRP